MIRGTTPTHSFDLPIEASLIDRLTLVYRQKKEIKIRKTLNDVVLEGKRGHVKLREADTLALREEVDVDVQLRCGYDIGDDEFRYASTEVTLPVERILEDGPLLVE